MPKVVKLNDEEKHFLAIAKILWAGKWVITLLTICTVFSSVIFLNFSQPKFKVSLNYSVKLAPTAIYTKCAERLTCIQKLTDKKILAILAGEWSVRNNLLILTTTNTKDFSEYEKEIDELNKTLSTEIYNDAVREVNLITQGLEIYLESNPELMKRFLNAKLVIHTFENREDLISFGDISIKEVPSNFMLMTAISLIMGLFLGFVTVLLSNFLIRIKENWAET